ncbi:MAG TPA: DUF2783 domain-containing protein [Rhodobacteraceae bacterium]|nr:DUF2783 domain-containing protein [Paracoccaceae bacterium]
MSTLITEPNIPDPDGLYADLIALHDGLADEDSHALNARLILILANHIGDREVLRAAFELARKTATGAPSAKQAGGGAS